MPRKPRKMAGLTEHTQKSLKRCSDTPIDEEKENRRKHGKNKDHDRGEQHFATGWPNNLGNLGADLLNELDQGCAGHAVSFAISARDTGSRGLVQPTPA